MSAGWARRPRSATSTSGAWSAVAAPNTRWAKASVSSRAARALGSPAFSSFSSSVASIGSDRARSRSEPAGLAGRSSPANACFQSACQAGAAGSPVGSTRRAISARAPSACILENGRSAIRHSRRNWLATVSYSARNRFSRPASAAIQSPSAKRARASSRLAIVSYRYAMRPSSPAPKSRSAKRAASAGETPASAVQSGSASEPPGVRIRPSANRRLRPNAAKVAAS